MTTAQFDQSVKRAIQSLIRRAEANYAKQQHDEYDLSFVESFSQWLDAKNDAMPEPISFEEWLQQNGDSI